jgi:SAM-dependent methyltransferase
MLDVQPRALNQLSPAERFFIKPEYSARSEAFYFHDSAADATVWQPEAYPFAAHLARRYGCSHIIDIGCGNGRKLASLAPEFKIIGLDFGANLEYCRATYPFGEWYEADLDRPYTAPIPAEVLRDSIIICADVVEHLVHPNHLLNTLNDMLQHAPAAVITTPERDLVRGPQDVGPPANPAHVREWTLHELEQFMLSAGIKVGFSGLTMDNNVVWQKATSLLVLENANRPELQAAPEDFRVVAVVSAWDNALTIEACVGHLLDQGIGVYVIDHGSTDNTLACLDQFAGRGLLGIDRLDVAEPTLAAHQEAENARVRELVTQLPADWFVYQRADVIRSSPWRAMSLRDGLAQADRRGYTRVAHTPIACYADFGTLAPGADLNNQARRFRFDPTAARTVQIAAWKNDGQLGKTGGLFPYNFLEREYVTEGAPMPPGQVVPAAQGWRGGLELYDDQVFNVVHLVERLSGIGTARL